MMSQERSEVASLLAYEEYRGGEFGECELSPGIKFDIKKLGEGEELESSRAEMKTSGYNYNNDTGWRPGLTCRPGTPRKHRRCLCH